MKTKPGSGLFDSGGRPSFGIYTTPFKSLDIGDFRPYGKKGRASSGIPGLKRWIFLGVSGREFSFGLAVVHLGYLSNLFAYCYDRSAGRIVSEADIIAPFGMNTLFAGSGSEGGISFSFGGCRAQITLMKKAAALKAEMGKGFSAALEFKRVEKSMNAVTRNGLKGFNYTLKEAGLEASGFVRARGKEYDVKPGPCANIDYTFGIPARSTFWNWACGSGAGSRGSKIGFNFAQGINETGHTENAFWVNGKMVKVDSVDFIYNDLELLEEWRITSSDKKVDLVFKPEGERGKNLNIGLITSYYHQPFGMFYGTLGDGKRKYALKEVYGFTEEHEARW
ncbi:MAG TPA: DUF2804 domain-containing protein [bacterium]|nr:DUF2804 domain-containing protein [bacterium]